MSARPWRRAWPSLTVSHNWHRPALLCGGCWRLRWRYRRTPLGVWPYWAGLRLLTSPRRHG